MTAGHCDVSVQGFATGQKEHVRFCRSTSTTWWTKRATLLVLQLSPIVSDLSTSFNWMNLNMWSCTSSSLFLAQCSLDFRSTKRALFEVLSTKSSTKRQKKRGTLKALLNPNFTSTKYSALVYNFRKELERYKAGPVRREPCLVESSAEWTRSLPLSWVRWSTVTGCKSFFYRFFFHGFSVVL